MSEVLVPIYDPTRGFRTWIISEIYKGTTGGRYVPNVDDLVIDWTTGFYRVVGVNDVTGLSVLESWTGPKETEGAISALLGVDIGAQGESYRVYIDNSVTPHTLACDSRLHVYGSSNSYIKVFKGTDITNSGVVVSAVFNGDGLFISENIPLELVAHQEFSNTAIKTPTVGYTRTSLEDGEVVTVVVYDDLGYVTSYNTLLVKNTSFIRSTDASKKYVAGIAIESPYLDPNSNKVLRIPMNAVVEHLPIYGVVTYSDGSVVKLPVNGGRFKLHGLDHFVATITGQSVPLVLSYYLGETEVCYGAQAGAQRHISVNYTSVTTAFEKSYSVKIFTFPRWVNDLQGYKLEYWLYNLDRCQVYNVSHLVSVLDTGEFFRPMEYGVKQNLTLGLNMSEVDSQYPNFRHIQTVEVTLLAPGNRNETSWLVGFSPNQNPPYGGGLKAKVKLENVNSWQLDISCGYLTKEAWLLGTYLATQPLFNTTNERNPPTPNILILKTKTRSYEISINDFATKQLIVNDLVDGENLMIECVRRLDETDIQLGIIALPIIQVIEF